MSKGFPCLGMPSPNGGRVPSADRQKASSAPPPAVDAHDVGHARGHLGPHDLARLGLHEQRAAVQLPHDELEAAERLDERDVLLDEQVRALALEGRVVLLLQHEHDLRCLWCVLCFVFCACG